MKPSAAAASRNYKGPPRNPPPNRGDAPGRAVVHPTFKEQVHSVTPSQQMSSPPVLQPPTRQHAGGDPPCAELPLFKDQVRQVEHLDDEEVGDTARKPLAVNAKPAIAAARMQQQQQQQQPPLPQQQQQQQQLETDASLVPMVEGIPVSLDHELATAPPQPQVPQPQPLPLPLPPPPPAIKKHIVWGMVVVVVAIVVAVAAVVGSLLSSNSNGSAPATILSPTDPNPTTAGEPAVLTTVSPTSDPQMDDSSTQSPAQTSTPPPQSTPPSPRPTTPQPITPFPIAATPSPTVPPTTPPQQSITASPISTPEPTTGDNTNPAIPAVEAAKLTASDGAAFDRFGESVAIHGDTLVIGAWADDTENGENSGTNSGSAYVYTRSGTAWTEQTKLTASDGAADDQFGISVSINGDTIVIGASEYTEDNGIGSGSAYVYTRSGTVWTEQAKLTASDGAGSDEFGISVAINVDTIVIGAFLDDTENGSGSGSAYVYTRSGSAWTEQAKLTASDGAAEDDFGWSVAIHGDTLVIGADNDVTENGSSSGSAYVYTRSGTAWTEQAKLTASDGAANDDFGSTSVAINVDTIVIGAFLDATENGSYSGSAYVYTRSGTAWTEQAKLTASDGAANDEFGWSVAINVDTIVIGAYVDDTENGTISGSAYVYTHSGTVWTEQAKLTASDGAAGDQFGVSVAMDGDTLVIGASSDNTESGVNRGSAYIFE